MYVILSYYNNYKNACPSRTVHIHMLTQAQKFDITRTHRIDGRRMIVLAIEASVAAPHMTMLEPAGGVDLCGGRVFRYGRAQNSQILKSF